MGACGMSWTVEVPPWGWSRFIGGWGVRGIDGWGRDVGFQPDRYGRVLAFAATNAVRQAEPGLGETIQRAARAAVIQDLPANGRGYGWKGGERRKALCQAIADRLNAVDGTFRLSPGEVADVLGDAHRKIARVTAIPARFLLSKSEAAAIRAQGDEARAS